ncbi:MAG: DUF6173 family protein [Pseudomonadota bacterium]
MDNKIATTAEAEELSAQPRCHEVHANPATSPTNVPAALNNQALAKKSQAQWAYERLILYIQNFEKTLDNEHEVAIGFTGSDAGVMRIEGMGFFDPDIVTFYGSDTVGSKTQLVQHVSQLNVMLRAVTKAVETSEPVRIGFQLADDLEKS